MTPQVKYYAEWRISTWQMYIEKRLASTNASIKASAEQCQREAKLLQTVIDTPPERHSPIQAIWHQWISEACALYHAAHKQSDYRQRAEILRQHRDMALMKGLAA